MPVKSWMRMLVGVGIAALLVVVAAGAGAWGAGGPSSARVSSLVGSAFRISGPQATSSENWPAVAWNGSGNEFLVVWSDGRNSSTRGSDIYGRRVSAAGSAVGPDFRISGPAAIDVESNPAVAWNATANEYLVVWDDNRNSSTRSLDIYGRRVSAAGTPLGADFRVSGAGAIWDDLWPAVAWDATANEYLVVWDDGRNSSTRSWDIYGRRVSAAGTPLGADFRVSGAGAISYENWPAVAWGGTANEFLVVWGDGRNFTSSLDDIYGRRVSAAGTPLGADFRISGPNAWSHEATPAVAYDSTANQFLVVWTDPRNIDTRGDDIYGRRVSAAGAPVGANFRISGPNAISYEANPAVAYNSTSNQFLVVWQDYRNSSSIDDIYGRRVSAAGTPVGADFRISGSYPTSEDEWPAVAYDSASNQFLVVWQDYRNFSTRGDDVYGRRVAV
jgi:hypothetical protein